MGIKTMNVPPPELTWVDSPVFLYCEAAGVTDTYRIQHKGGGSFYLFKCRPGEVYQLIQSCQSSKQARDRANKEESDGKD